MSTKLRLPISNPTAQAQAQAQVQQHTTLSSPSFWAFVKRLSDSGRRAFSRRRPWLELVDRSAFSRPNSLSDATARIRKNISYFRVNYLTVIASVLALSLLYHPFSLLTILTLLASWLFLYLLRPSDQPLVVLSRTFSDRETLGILIFVTVFVIFLTSVGSMLMSATIIGLGIVSVHGAFRDPEDLFLDDQELPGSGLFSFINNATSSAAASMPAAIVVVSGA
ncbi:hypothetical protein M9H77_00998 [Catharanthus roseus]|uniref:Uncharacterized protein n=1 Tax=Catharanthus roseus TaxID=4058 RepID=A0ACC0C4B3_CATRO|nr:hypothetical protein M9H77_00998 [Catharanthus roseus]